MTQNTNALPALLQGFFATAAQQSLETMDCGQQPENVQPQLAAAHCVANGAVGLVERALKAISVPTPDLFELMFAGSSEGYKPAEGEETPQSVSAQVRALLAGDDATYTKAQLTLVAALIEFAEDAHSYSVRNRQGAETPSSDDFEGRLAALKTLQSALATRIESAATQVAAATGDVAVVAAGLLDAAKFMLKGSTEDVSAAEGNALTVPEEAQPNFEDDPEMKEIAEAMPGLVAEMNTRFAEVANELVGVGQSGTTIGFLAAGEKEASVATAILDTLDQQLSSSAS